MPETTGMKLMSSIVTKTSPPTQFNSTWLLRQIEENTFPVEQFSRSEKPWPVKIILVREAELAVDYVFSPNTA